MRFRFLRRCHDDERGAFLVLWAFLLVGILTLVAIVIDLGQLKATHRSGQTIADLAGLAAGKSLSSGLPQTACADALKYISANAGDLPATANPAANTCSSLQTFAACLASPAPANAGYVGATGPYTVTIRYPVADTDAAMTDGFRTVNASIDGAPCDRMAVTVTRTRPTFFGGIVGVNSLTTHASAVIKIATTKTKRIPALWLLEPTNCTALKVSGSGTALNIGDLTATPVVPGFVSIDSDGTGCTGSSTTLSVATGTLHAVPTSGATTGLIQLFAMANGSTSCSGSTLHDCDPSDASSGRVAPQPNPSGERATRAPVDWTYNCKASYPNYQPGSVAVAIAPCPNTGDGTHFPYIDNLVSAIGNTTGVAPATGAWQRWTTTGHSCNPSGTITVTGNWWVDCNTLSLGTGSTLTFADGNVVIDGQIKLTGSGALNMNTANAVSGLPAACLPAQNVVVPCVNNASAKAAILYMRNNDLNLNGGGINLSHVFVYQANGVLGNTGGSPPVWSAPTEGPFGYIALWSEKNSSGYQMNGGSSMSLAGIFFTPYGDMSISGGSPVAQQNAQFIARTLAISGGATFNLAPDAQNFVSLPPKAGTLIR